MNGGEVCSDSSMSEAVKRGLRELAEVCDTGRSSGWPSRDPWRNSEAWQNTYVALATRIIDGRVDVDRPLSPLARLSAWRFMINEQRRQQRVVQLTEPQQHRFHLGEERTLEEMAEDSRRNDVLRLALLRQIDAGKLSDVDMTILIRRYVDEWGASEVAEAMGISPANVRKICSRRCLMLRDELLELGLSPG